jgi:16S rRNA (guanine966-N2)-methyltransferase
MVRAGDSVRKCRRPKALPLCWLAMRIIAGTFRSRTLAAPPGMSTRPTSDRLRETLFNVLAPRIQHSFSEGVAFLDLYAGSGAVGLEAISRGAARVTFVERAPAALKILNANLERLGISSGVRVQAKSVSAFLKSASLPDPKSAGLKSTDPKPASPNPERYDVVFLDPPYDEAKEYAITLELLGGAAQGILAPGAVVVAEHRRKQSLEERYGNLKRTRVLEQGDAALSFYAVDSQSAGEP